MSSVSAYSPLWPASSRAEKSPWRMWEAQAAMLRMGVSNARRLRTKSAAISPASTPVDRS